MSLKILQVGSSLPGSGGIEKSVLHLSEGLRERGALVHIAAIPKSWLSKTAQERKFEVVPLQLRSQHDWSGLRPYVQLLRREKYDVINMHFSPDYLVPALAARIVGDQRTVLTRYMVLPWKGLKRWMYGVALYDRIIGVSDAVRNRLIAGGLAESKVVTVYGGVEKHLTEVTPACLREELSLPPETVLIGIVARLSPEKGHRPLIAAMRDVDSRAVCVVAGDGPEKERLHALVREQGLENRVRFLGWRLDSDAVIAALDIVVQPSLWEEACSLSIMEAMALAKPLVVTQAGGNVEQVLHNETGLTVPKEDIAALAAALNRLVADEPLRARMGAGAKLRQQSVFSLQSMAEGTEAVYTQLRK